MTAKELIAKLESLPGDCEIVVFGKVETTMQGERVQICSESAHVTKDENIAFIDFYASRPSDN